MARSEPARRLSCWLAARYIRLVYATSRWRVVGGDIPRRFWRRGEPFLLCFWHGRLMMMPKCWDPDVPIRVLISRHRDGEMISRTVAHFGIGTVWGSSSRGGVAALRTIYRTLEEERACVGFTPDGPRGPRMRASAGVVAAARRTGAPIVCCSYSVSRGRLLGSWDRFLLPLPFSRGVFVWGAPIAVPREARGAALERLRRAVEERLNEITREADRLSGRPAVEPAPHEAPDTAPGRATPEATPEAAADGKRAAGAPRAAGGR